jgi:hypothetical protein
MPTASLPCRKGLRTTLGLFYNLDRKYITVIYNPVVVMGLPPATSAPLWAGCGG